MQFYCKYAKPLFSSIKYFMWGSHAWSKDGFRECGILDHLSASSPKQVWPVLPFFWKAWKYALLMCSLVPHQKSTFRLRFYDSLRSVVLNHWRIQVFLRRGAQGQVYPDVYWLHQWRTQKFSWWGFTQWHMVDISIWCALFVTSESDVIFMFPNQHFNEVSWQVFLRCRDPSRAPRIENRVPRIKEKHHRVRRIR